MQRNIDKIADTDFDVIVVGGGIHGAVLSLVASKAGYKVALIEQRDWGWATSANSLKIIHGGIRYLQHGDFVRMRESIRSRRSMMRFAPHLVKPLSCVMPTYGHGIKGREVMGLAFKVYDWIACDRNRDLLGSCWLPDTKKLSPQEILKEVPYIKKENLTGGAVWYDAIAVNSERLVLEYVKEACCYGATAINYMRVDDIIVEDGIAKGVRSSDLLSGRKLEVFSGTVVNATGPWLNNLRPCNNQSSQQWAIAVNIIIKKKLFDKYAVGLEGYTDYTDTDALIKRGKRLFFFVPWRDKYTIIGTNYIPYKGDPANFKLNRGLVSKMIADVNKIYPHADLTMADIGHYHGGLVPMLSNSSQEEENNFENDSVQLDKSSLIIDHGNKKESGVNSPVKGLVSIKGVKYTTAQDVGEKVVRLLGRKYLDKPGQACYADEYVKEKKSHDFSDLAQYLSERYKEICTLFKNRYGRDWRRVMAYIERSDLAENNLLDVTGNFFDPKDFDSRVFAAEIRYFIKEEMAFRLSDIVFRRSALGSAECPKKDTLEKILEIIQQMLDLNKDMCEEQMAEVIDRYSILQEGTVLSELKTSTKPCI